MVCEKPMEQSNEVDAVLVLSNSAEQATVAHENGIPSASILSKQFAASNIKSEIGQVPVAEQDVHNPPTSYYNYCYPGYNCSFGQSNDRNDHSSMGAQPDHSSVAYYMPGYSPYTSQPYFTPSGYLQNPVTYGAEAVPCYAWDMNDLGNSSNGSTLNPGTVNSGPSPATTRRSNGIKPSKLYGSAINKHATVSLNPKSCLSVSTSNVSQRKFDTQPPVRPLNKSGSYYQSPGSAHVYHPSGSFQPLSFNKRDTFANNEPMGYRSNVRTWDANNKLRPNGPSGYDMAGELTCGPRAQNNSNSGSSVKEPLVLRVQKDKYNLLDFQTEYENAKFYVIKSYSEDDVHKCIKYAVWSSTASGNKKLDAAFHDAEVKANEVGTKCPIFLFFSVNGSGQFVGLAEMTGKVDFNKSMDFWQLDKWSGFFPVKWHIVKDIPNSQLRHILLENNENRPVTYTRDTQEIGLKQGLEMLKIFKNYLAKTSLLDDIDFYEDREKALESRKSGKAGAHEIEIFGNGDLPLEREVKVGEELRKPQMNSVSALANLTKNLSLNTDATLML